MIWIHVDLDDNSFAWSRVAVSDQATKSFNYIESVRTNGYVFRDTTVFLDDDGKAYHFYYSEYNRTTHVAFVVWWLLEAYFEL